ncbi:Hypothetical predicted protein [Pelobates cultripes]|uniref:Uncharacterized protein n=1 Tax=Pelobates cultripes TaxID=61616 RepID=A0AAD1TA57_PELCU|nr:Hypothetical predicted protein [Pelobates cultripes]
MPTHHEREPRYSPPWTVGGDRGPYQGGEPGTERVQGGTAPTCMLHDATPKMADVSCLPEPIDPQLEVLHRLEAIFANFWHKLEARTQPLISTQANSFPAKTLPPTRKKAQQGIINTAGKATTTPAQKGENRQETPQQTQGTAESQNPPGPFILPDNAEVQITAESSPTADTSPRSKQVTSSDTRTQKPTPPRRDAEKQDTQESSQGLRLAPRGDRISMGSGIGSAEHSSLQQDFFTHPAHQLNLKYQSLS